MRRHRSVLLATLLAVFAAAPYAAAYSPMPSGSDHIGSEKGLLVAMLVALIGVGLFAMVRDCRRRRAERVLHLQGALSEALRRESAHGVCVTPLVTLLGWGGCLVRIEVVGVIPSEPSRQVALQIVSHEACRQGLTFDLHDHLWVSRVA